MSTRELDISISIIIPVYNGEKYIYDTLISLSRQTFKNFEIIIVNDGSNDNTEKLVQKFINQNKRICVKYIKQNNQGMSFARLAGYRISTSGSSIMFLDGDDIFSEKMLEIAYKYREVDICCSTYIEKRSSEMNQLLIDKSVRDADLKVISYSEGLNVLETLHNNSNKYGNLNLTGILIKRSFFEEVEHELLSLSEKFPQNFLNDVCCIPRFLYCAKSVSLILTPLTYHRIANDTDSRILIPNKLHYELVHVSKSNVEFFYDNEFNKFYERELLAFYLIMLKLWYQTNKYETDKTVTREYNGIISKYYNDYYKKFLKIKSDSLHVFLAKCTVILFKISPWLWEKTIGFFRYELEYKYEK